jgi:hypothetical protein
MGDLIPSGAETEFVLVTVRRFRHGDVVPIDFDGVRSAVGSYGAVMYQDDEDMFVIEAPDGSQAELTGSGLDADIDVFELDLAIEPSPVLFQEIFELIRACDLSLLLDRTPLVISASESIRRHLPPESRDSSVVAASPGELERLLVEGMARRR